MRDSDIATQPKRHSSGDRAGAWIMASLAILAVVGGIFLIISSAIDGDWLRAGAFVLAVLFFGTVGIGTAFDSSKRVM